MPIVWHERDAADVSIIVVTFGVDADGEGFIHALGDGLGIAPAAISEARAGAYGEPHDGHRLVVVRVGPSQEADAAALALSWRGQLHEPPHPVQVPT